MRTDYWYNGLHSGGNKVSIDVEDEHRREGNGFNLGQSAPLMGMRLSERHF